VIGGLAATIRLHDLDVRACRNVQLTNLGPSPQRDDREMLEQQNGVGQRSPGDGICDRPLKLPGLEIVHGAKV